MAAVASAWRALARSTKPLVCYAVEQLPAKKGGDALYEQLRTAVAPGDAELREAPRSRPLQRRAPR